jgi:hypothetical protein
MNRKLALLEKTKTYLKAEVVSNKEWQELAREFIAVVSSDLNDQTGPEEGVPSGAIDSWSIFDFRDRKSLWQAFFISMVWWVLFVGFMGVLVYIFLTA